MKSTASCLLIGVVFLGFLQGCASTKVNNSHFMLSKGAGGAEVYFIRPATERPLGMGDNALEIDIEDEPLLMLAKNEFVGVRIRPGNMDVFARIIGQIGQEMQRRQITRKDRFSFKDKQQHFILLKMIDSEFRGLSFAPVEIDVEQAALILKGMKPIGALAVQLRGPML